MHDAYLIVWLKYGWHSGPVCQMADLPNFDHLTTLKNLVYGIVSGPWVHVALSGNDPNGKALSFFCQLFAHMVMKDFFEAGVGFPSNDDGSAILFVSGPDQFTNNIRSMDGLRKHDADHGR